MATDGPYIGGGRYPCTSRSGSCRRSASYAPKSAATRDSGEPSTPTTTGVRVALFMGTSLSPQPGDGFASPATSPVDHILHRSAPGREAGLPVADPQHHLRGTVPPQPLAQVLAGVRALDG